MYRIESYPDGSKYVVVESFVAQVSIAINSYEDLWILRQLKDVYDHNGQNADLVITSLIDAQADRRFESDQPHGLKLVCEFINSMDWLSVSVFHPHNPEVAEALISNVRIISNKNFVQKVLEEEGKDLILMSSDAGGFKPLMKLCKEIDWEGEVYSASKSRDPKTGELFQIVDRSDFQGKDILIVDDLCVFGGTFLGLAKKLKDRNVGRLLLAVSHITVDTPREGLSEVFSKVYTTNSKGLKYPEFITVLE